MTTTNDDALSELCAAERGTEVPPPDAADAGWDRLQSALWPGPEGGDGGDAPGGDAPPSIPAAGSSAAAAGGLPGAVKVAAALAVATAVGVGIALASSPDPTASEPSIATATVTTSEATPQPMSGDDRPALRAADPEPPQVAGPTGDALPPDDPPREDETLEPAPSERASPEPGKRSTALPDVPGVGLAHEVAILREASTALAAGKPAAALRWTRRHAADHPDGSLTEERMATEAIARCQLHDRRARAVSDRFLQRYPRSTHESRVRAACETMDP